MRAILASLLLIALASPARADSYVGLAGGLALPLSDDQYTDAVNNSPVLGVRVGATPKAIGGFISFDWMIADAKSDGALGLDVSAHRFRLLVGPELRHPVSNTLAVTGKAGVGLDIAHSNVSGSFLGVDVDESETDTGIGFEFGAGVWFGFGGVEIGGEATIPVGIHSEDNNQQGSYDYDYTAIDLQLMFGVRFISRSAD